MVTITKETVGEWLERLAKSNESEELDSVKMQNLLHRIGFPKARVVCGRVYVEGHGTIENRPTSIHSYARIISDVGKTAR